MTRRSTPPSRRPSTCSRNAARIAASSGVARLVRRRAERTDRPGDERVAAATSRASRATWAARRLSATASAARPNGASRTRLAPNVSGLDQVGAGVEVLAMDRPDEVRAGRRELVEARPLGDAPARTGGCPCRRRRAAGETGRAVARGEASVGAGRRGAVGVGGHVARQRTCRGRSRSPAAGRASGCRPVPAGPGAAGAGRCTCIHECGPYAPASRSRRGRRGRAAAGRWTPRVSVALADRAVDAGRGARSVPVGSSRRPSPRRDRLERPAERRERDDRVDRAVERRADELGHAGVEDDQVSASGALPRVEDRATSDAGAGRRGTDRARWRVATGAGPPARVEQRLVLAAANARGRRDRARTRRPGSRRRRRTCRSRAARPEEREHRDRAANGVTPRVDRARAASRRGDGCRASASGPSAPQARAAVAQLGLGQPELATSPGPTASPGWVSGRTSGFRRRRTSSGGMPSRPRPAAPGQPGQRVQLLGASIATQRSGSPAAAAGRHRADRRRSCRPPRA